MNSFLQEIRVYYTQSGTTKTVFFMSPAVAEILFSTEEIFYDFRENNDIYNYFIKGLGIDDNFNRAFNVLGNYSLLKIRFRHFGGSVSRSILPTIITGINAAIPLFLNVFLVDKREAAIASFCWVLGNLFSLMYSRSNTNFIGRLIILLTFISIMALIYEMVALIDIFGVLEQSNGEQTRSDAINMQLFYDRTNMSNSFYREIQNADIILTEQTERIQRAVSRHPFMQKGVFEGFYEAVTNIFSEQRPMTEAEAAAYVDILSDYSQHPDKYRGGILQVTDNSDFSKVVRHYQNEFSQRTFDMVDFIKIWRTAAKFFDMEDNTEMIRYPSGMIMTESEIQDLNKSTRRLLREALQVSQNMIIKPILQDVSDFILINNGLTPEESQFLTSANGNYLKNVVIKFVPASSVCLAAIMKWTSMRSSKSVRERELISLSEQIEKENIKESLRWLRKNCIAVNNYFTSSKLFYFLTAYTAIRLKAIFDTRAEINLSMTSLANELIFPGFEAGMALMGPMGIAIARTTTVTLRRFMPSLQVYAETQGDIAYLQYAINSLRELLGTDEMLNPNRRAKIIYDNAQLNDLLDYSAIFMAMMIIFEISRKREYGSDRERKIPYIKYEPVNIMDIMSQRRRPRVEVLEENPYSSSYDYCSRNQDQLVKELEYDESIEEEAASMRATIISPVTTRRQIPRKQSTPEREYKNEDGYDTQAGSEFETSPQIRAKSMAKILSAHIFKR